jgi:hypothetical protein
MTGFGNIHAVMKLANTIVLKVARIVYGTDDFKQYV